MIVRVSDIPEDGLHIDSPELLAGAFPDASWSLREVALHVQKEGEDVVVEGSLTASVPQVCGRCLESFDLTVTPQVTTRFVPPPAAGSGEQELGADDLETDTYDHGQLDLARLVEAETILGLPMKPLCRENCLGLCSACGANRNVTPCACEATASDPRWASLQKLAERLSR
ncbi:MAG: DUF177 domain-containing protein [Candidatus Rokuibacteriota bacterium]